MVTLFISAVQKIEHRFVELLRTRLRDRMAAAIEDDQLRAGYSAGKRL